MGEFITVEVKDAECAGVKECGRCVTVCPVNIFVIKGLYPEAIPEKEDECTLCELCLQACPFNAIIIHKLYED